MGCHHYLELQVATGEGVDGFAEFLEGGWGVKFIHDWQGGDALNDDILP